MKQKFLFPYLVFFLLILSKFSYGRPITDQAPLVMISDGVHDFREETHIYLSQDISSNTCTESYGFLPCTTNVLGNVFLIVVYGYLMFLAAKSLSAGSEILLQILGPGIIGGLFLPVLSSLPDATIILASGLSGSKETAQSQVSVGMGLLAGSTVMLLTILWGTCLIVGRCDLENSVAIDQKDTKGFDLAGSGISTDIWTSYAARIMIISVIPFVIVQLPQVIHGTPPSRVAVLLSLIVSICLVVIYTLYQIFQPRIQRRKLAYVKYKNLMSGLLELLKSQAVGRFLNDNGEPHTEVIEKLFESLKNLDGYITAKDLRALLIGVHFEEKDMNIDEAVARIMLDFDRSHDSRIDREEFVRGITKWLRKAKHYATQNDHSPKTPRLLNDFHQRTQAEQDLLVENSDETVERVKNPKWNTLKAVMMLLLGTAVAAAFADPLVDAVDNFSTATSIPSFFVSFVILPFASSSEVVSALIFASRKKIRTASLTYSEIYGSVTMSNILSLSVFLGLVYIRDLTWNFESEVFVILIVCIVMGLVASFRTTFPLWLCFPAYALYPLSLLFVYILNCYM
ncbi:Sodium/calcium exchanger membrane region [Sesbania bispinosa]|nr:Sodium/calcium exchanger membrane region [Sesbania bispinosa]